MRLRADEVEKMAHKLSNIFVNDENRFYDVCGKLFIYLKCVGDEVNAELIKRELRRDFDKIPREFMPIFGVDMDVFSFKSVERSVLCACSKMVSGMKFSFLDKVILLFDVFKKFKSGEELVRCFKWIELVMFKNHDAIKLDEILEGGSV